MDNFENYYETLGINPGASPDEIKRAYLDKCFILHPDRMSGAPESARKKAEKELATVNRAHDVLKDPYRRQAYLDRWFNKNNAPKPVVKPAYVMFGTLEPGQKKKTKFIIENSGGSYSKLWISNPDSWLKVVSWRSLSEEELPLEVEIEATAEEWGETRNESIQVKLDEEETKVDVTLEVKPGPNAETAFHTRQHVKQNPATSPKKNLIPRRRVMAYMAIGILILLTAILLPVMNMSGLANGMDTTFIDTNRIAYITQNGSTNTMNIINANGTGHIAFQHNNFEKAIDIHWSPDLKRIMVNQVIPDNADTLINVYKTDTGISSPAKYSVQGMAPVWSPDSKKIMFSSAKVANRQVYIMEEDGDNIIRITNEETGILGYSTAWYPDSLRIMYMAKSNRGTDIFEVSTEGLNKTRLTAYPVSNTEIFKWSPDGQKIAFIAEAGNLFIMETDGKNRKKLTNDSICSEFLWSPDSRNIAFCTTSTENGNQYQIYITDSEEIEPVNIIGSEETTGSMFAWSPDGTRLAFVVMSPDRADIYSVNSNGSGLSQLTANNNYNLFPAWSPDGKNIAYTNLNDRQIENSEAEIFIMNSLGSNKSRLTKGFHPVWSPR